LVEIYSILTLLLYGQKEASIVDIKIENVRDMEYHYHSQKHCMRHGQSYKDTP